MKYFKVLVFFSTGCLVLGPVPSVAIFQGFSQTIGTMNSQLTKFMEGLHSSVDVWTNKVIDNAIKEECFFLCPKGQEPLVREGFNFTPNGCSTFGNQVKDEDLPSKNMRACCNQQQQCYYSCNSNKTMCEIKFQECLHQQCIILTKDKPMASKHLAVCDTATKLLLLGNLSFGCKTYKDAQRETCICSAANEP